MDFFTVVLILAVVVGAGYVLYKLITKDDPVGYDEEDYM